MTPLAVLHRVAATVTGVPAAVPLPPAAAPSPLPASFLDTEVGRVAATCLTEKEN